jgi:hypothetical protein
MAKQAAPEYPQAMAKSTLHILAPASIICGALSLLSGCSNEPDSHLVSAPPPQSPATTNSTVMTTTTSTAPAVVSNPAYVTTSNPAYVTTPVVSTVLVTQAPPMQQQEVVIAQPSPQDVWIAGFWTWRDSQYQWMAGHWEMPPNASAVWVAPRWEQEGNAYRFHEGYWN